MTKYREYFERMITSEKEAFDAFTKLHMQYSMNQDELQEKFNEEGTKVVTIIRDWENKLCSTSDKAGYGGYTSNLSEKFWSEVRKSYPLIDYVGVIVKKSTPKVNAEVKDSFSIKKIKFS